VRVCACVRLCVCVCVSVRECVSESSRYHPKWRNHKKVASHVSSVMVLLRNEKKILQISNNPVFHCFRCTLELLAFYVHISLDSIFLYSMLPSFRVPR
jgi:hypothetical protein